MTRPNDGSPPSTDAPKASGVPERSRDREGSAAEKVSRRFDRIVESWDTIADLAIPLILGHLCIVICVIAGHLVWATVPIWINLLFCLSWYKTYQRTVAWARDQRLTIQSVSPRMLPLRKGRFAFWELAVARFVASDNSGRRGGWLVIYVGQESWWKHPSWNDIAVHWDDES